MISWEFFIEQFKNFTDLMGWRITEKRARLIYEKIMNFEKEDLKRALDNLIIYENFQFHQLLSLFNRYKGEREDQKQKERQEKERQEFMLWWASHKGTRQECINNYECFSCKRVYCDIVATETLKGIKDILSKRKICEEVCRELCRFKGVGFEKDIPEHQPF